LSKERSIELNSPGGYGYYNTAIQNKYVVTNTLSYEKSFGSLSGVVGSTYEQNDVIEATVEASDFASDLQC
jgi:phosphoserine aminotransferase